jgi:hypothetical protein
MKKCFIVAALALCCLASANLFGEVPLYGRMDVSPEAVSQGALGSCYFHAAVAALAATQPGTLRAAIRPNGKNFTVTFADGKQETVYPDDVHFARESNYDASDGLWVAVLFRGYAQRTLRASLLEAADKGPMGMKWAAGLIFRSSSADSLLLAYDRAIRSQIDQAGNVSRDGLKAQLREEFKAYPIPPDMRDRAVDWLDSAGFFNSLAESVKTNSHLYGAYRAVGQGGVVEDVFRAFTGQGASFHIKSAEQANAAISAEVRKNRPVVAWTSEAPVEQMTAKWGAVLGPDVNNWYLDSHAYTVLGVDPSTGTVRLRNPAGHMPDPNGEFSLPWRLFSVAYTGYSIAAPAR